ncbi:unnamed protein product [Leptidea sinapis]|uniref:Uncharacterized protein n=1 Tax=Leptidea sinapis TaxID=189913 RepID=A0A5E4QQ10_9NEOP|nr:unnamed protein product [Leptidea sinapis]
MSVGAPITHDAVSCTLSTLTSPLARAFGRLVRRGGAALGLKTTSVQKHKKIYVEKTLQIGINGDGISPEVES